MGRFVQRMGAAGVAAMVGSALLVGCTDDDPEVADATTESSAVTTSATTGSATDTASASGGIKLDCWDLENSGIRSEAEARAMGLEPCNL